MKSPGVEECPCCGVPVRNGAGVRNIRPVCKHDVRGSGGERQSFGLFWYCDVCGCEWEDGQFVGVKPDGAAP